MHAIAPNDQAAGRTAGIRTVTADVPTSARAGLPHRPAQVSPLLTAKQAASEVFGVSLRTFHNIRGQGLLPDPVIIGFRHLRWVRAELEQAALSMPRKAREQVQEPESLRARREVLAAGDDKVA